MKSDFLRACAIVISIEACGGLHADDSGTDHGYGGHGGTSGNTGGAATNDHAGAGTGASAGHAAAGTADDDHGDAGAPDTDDNGDAGAPENDGDGEAGTSEVNGDAGAADNGGHDKSGGSKGNGHGGSAGTGGKSSNGGSGARAANAGAGGLAVSAGSGGRAANAGSGGLAEIAGMGGLSASAGSGGASANAGTGGLAANAGSGGVAADGGTGGVSANGGLGGSAGAGGNSSVDAEYLFTQEQFGGNGRTCTTCHTAETGTISPAQVQALYAANPDDALFRPIDSDDGAGDDYTELQQHATFRVSINLPSGVVLTSDPNATSVVLRRGAPTTINTPALDTVLMWDGREPSLTQQALDAILGHAQATVTPTTDQLQLIAGFEQGPDFFSSDLLRNYSEGGPEPTWPQGTTDSEQRGRRWFAQDSAAPRFNICGQCHGGPMANTTQSNSGLPAGKRFQTVNVSEFNEIGNPTYEFSFPDPNHPGQRVTVTTPDPGRALVTGDVRDVNFFKIPSLWGVKNTAPYFHDSSAATLDDLMNHYEKHLATFLPKNASYPTPHVPTAQDKADIIAYLQLL